jgi:sulfur-carrier protein
VNADEVPAPVAEPGTITVRFWAGAKRAAGHSEEQVSAATVGDLRVLLGTRRALHDIMQAAAILVDEAPATDATPLRPGALVDVLPPFAGG